MKLWRSTAGYVQPRWSLCHARIALRGRRRPACTVVHARPLSHRTVHGIGRHSTACARRGTARLRRTHRAKRVIRTERCGPFACESEGARACPQILAAHESRRAADGASDELTLLVAQSHCSIGLVFLKQATLGVCDGPQQRINASGACAVPSGTPVAHIGEQLLAQHAS